MNPYRITQIFHLKQLPVQGEDIKHFCCWPCRQGKAILTFKLEKSAFAINEIVCYSAEIDNQSSNDIEGMSVKLIKVVTFTAHTPEHKTQTESTTIAKREYNDTFLRLTKRIINGSVGIPETQVSTLDDCIISTTYFFRVHLKTGGCHTDLNLDVKIIIGSIGSLDNAGPIVVAPSQSNFLYGASMPMPALSQLPGHKPQATAPIEANYGFLAPSAPPVCSESSSLLNQPPSYNEAGK